jgi:hypothetical protein
MSLHCRACSRMPIDLINKAIEKAKGRFTVEKADESDMKSKARVVTAVIEDLAVEANIGLSHKG